jgi:hypothetical protein
VKIKKNKQEERSNCDGLNFFKKKKERKRPRHLDLVDLEYMGLKKKT